MRQSLLTIPAVLLLGVAACSGDEPEEMEPPVDTEAVENTDESEPTVPVDLDLVEASGACPFIDGEALETITGVDFRYASGGPGEDVEDEEDAPNLATCVIKTSEGSYPDLSLYVTGTEASAEVYAEELADNAEELDGLGEAAYWIVHTEDTGAGPSLEMGWYDEGNVFEMRYTAPEETEAAAVTDLVGGFTELANGINTAQAEVAE